TIGITVVGYQPNNSWVDHYEIATSNAADVDGPGAWPQFHHDPQLTGNADAPLVTPFSAYSRIAGATPDATAAAELEHQFDFAAGSCPGSASTRPVLLATDGAYPDALVSAPLARSLATGTLLTAPTVLSAPTRAALAKEGITHVTVVGGPSAVSATVVKQLQAMPATTCGGKTRTGSDITVTRLAGVTMYETAAQVAAAAAADSGGVGGLDLAGAYAGTNGARGRGRFNDTAGTASGAAPGGTLATAVLATGAAFPDAEAASTLAYAERLPILLTTSAALPGATASAISSLHVAQVVVMGGPLAVSDSVVAAIEHLGVSVLRVAGQDATDTAVELARLETSPVGTGAGWHGTGDLTVAQGAYFTDGLTGAVVAGDGPAASGPEPLVLTESPTTVGAPLTAFLHQAGSAGLGGTRVASFTILGGALAITPQVVEQMGHDL
ncbi:MAG: cell wall-binding repeat-containing protein, partial [Acidimicrobiales bacterium]